MTSGCEQARDLAEGQRPSKSLSGTDDAGGRNGRRDGVVAHGIQPAEQCG